MQAISTGLVGVNLSIPTCTRNWLSAQASTLCSLCWSTMLFLVVLQHEYSKQGTTQQPVSATCTQGPLL